jgi:hypothetical protein
MLCQHSISIILQMEQPVNHRRATRNRLAKNHRRVTGSKPKRSNASAVTNGTRVLLPLNEIAIQRRTRDLLDTLVNHCGGWDRITAIELAKIRIVVPQLVELERRASIFAKVRGADDVELSVYNSTANSANRTLDGLDAEVRSIDVTPMLNEYVRDNYQQGEHEPHRQEHDSS